MSLKSLIVRIKGDNKGLKSSLKDSEKSVSRFGGAIKKLGGMILAAFALRQIAAFGKEVFLLAAKAQGVREAFQRIADDDSLGNLRKATKGTVSDLALMTKAVEASNFQLPLKELPGLFEFASKRAQQTGQSVDYLVNSIVLGIGRKSPLILDNLGISAIRLREELKGAGSEVSTVADVAAAVARIAGEEMKKAGGITDTTQVRIEQLAASWTNLKIKAGEFASNSKVIRDSIKEWSIFFDSFNDSSMTFWKRLKLISGSTKKYLEYAKELEDRQNAINNKALDAALALGAENDELERFLNLLGNSQKAYKPQEQTLAGINAEIESYKKILAETNILDTEKIKNIYKEIHALEKLKKSIENLGVERDTSVRGGGKIAPNTTIPTIQGASEGITDISKTLKMPIVVTGGGMGVELANAVSKAFLDEQKWRQMATDWSQILQSAVMDVSAMLGDSIGRIFENITSGKKDQIGKDLLDNFASFLGNLGKMMVAYGVLNSAFYESLSAGPLGGPIAIAAGVAAIAVAGAIKGAIANSGSAMTGGGYPTTGRAAAQTQALTVQVQGKIKGSDIALASQRYTNGVNVTT